MLHTDTLSELCDPTDLLSAFENGSSALLVRFVGTIPVAFRGITYRFPIALWIPYGYPQEAPLVYVTATDQMTVRPGQHVSGDGRVYHHYLAHWGEAWDVSNALY
jgi:ESCRT-I complex subunit TSG101